MSNSHTQDASSEQAAEQRRRKRKERAAKSRTPEPKDIVSGAGQPLDPGVRRELEEQLGHDLGRVRLHTGRDAGQLTELLGADAVAVGQDIFFGEGTFRPGTDEGRRLLAHELLHTVQNPHGLGTLRAGRDLGAVSLPQQAIEREAESAAQDLVRPEAARTQESAPEVEEGQATPGWLRYATVDADRNRAEAIDPATLVDRLTNSVVRSLRGDPEDLSQRTRKQLAKLPVELLDGVLVRLEGRLLGSEHDRVLDLVDEIEAYDDYAEDGLERESHEAPQIEPDTAGEVRTERENELRDAERRKTEEQRPGLAPGPEKEQADEEGAVGSTPQNGGSPEHGSTPQGGGAPRGTEASASQGSGSAAPAAQKEQSSSPSSSSSGGKTEGGQQEGGKSQDSAAGKEKEKAGKEATEQEETPAASKEESAAKNRPGAAEAMVAGRQLKPQDKRGQEQPKGSPTMSGKDTQQPGRFSTLEGKRNQDVEGLEEETEEDPFGSGSESEVEVGGEEPSAWDIKLQPEDFLPSQDPDVSGVSTADELDPSSSTTPAVPSFPAPPPTRADEVRAQREAEDAEDEAVETEPEEEASPAETESSVPETEGGPDGGGGFGGLALEQAAAPPAPSSTASRDPKSGDDPKLGAVAAQTTVQEAPGRTDGKSEGGGEAKEAAAKEEKGTAAGGDQASAAPEKESQQAAGGAGSAASGTGSAGTAQDTDGVGASTGGAGGAGAPGGAAGGSPSASAETVVAAGAGAGAGVTGSPAAATDTATATAGGGSQETAPGPSAAAQAPAARTEAPAASPKSAPTTQEPASAPASAPKSAPEGKGVPETAPAPKSAAGSGGSSGGGGGGGGGGGTAAPARGKGKKDSAPAPNLSGVAPEAGLATASKLKPHKALEAMSGVGGAVDRSVGDEHKTLASAPPAMARPAGAPQTLDGKPTSDAPAQYSQDPAQQANEPDQENAEVTGAKEPEGQIEAEQAEEPSGWDTFKMALGFGIGKVASWLGFEVDAQELAAKFAGLPTKDEALKQAQAGNAPGVELQGGAEQASGEQGGHVDAKGQETIGTAQDDAGRGMGEDQVYPNAPKEQLTAKVPGQGGGGEGVGAEGRGATGAVPPEAASEVAEHERGPQFQAAFGEGQKGMSQGRQAKDRDFRDSQAKHKQQIDAEIATNTDTQAGEREKAMSDVTAQRDDWRTEQDKELKSLGDKKTDRQEKVRQDVKTEEENTDTKVETEKQGSDKKVKEESDKAEKDAEKQRDGATQESGNWITKAFDWIKQKVIEIKNAIVKVIRDARDAVVTFIRNFKKTVEDWINTARKNIIDAIKRLITDLIEFAKSMVRAIIDLAKRIRNLITSLIDAAIALVNKLATMLKQIISDLLDAIGKLLSSILEILKKALLDVVKAIVEAVKAVLDFAAGLLNALGEFMLIAVDFLSDPGGWLSGAKNSAVDGAKNHLFREVKSAVKEWFQSKIEEIIGVPKAILDKLIKGGITLERIVKETWDAIVPQLPFIIGEIVITKVIAKLIPGAGWVAAVIDAIRTAIGALGEILRAFGAVLDWLKAVRSGGAGILFAKAVAAGIVALLELAYEALLSGIGKYVAKVGRRFKDIAAKLGQGKGGKGDGKGPGAGGADDKGDGKKDRGEASQPGAEGRAPTVRPTATTPRPGQGKGGAPAKPEGTTGTKPPTAKAPAANTPTGKSPAANTPTGKSPAANTPTAKDKNGKPKDKDEDRPDTRPTPAPRPNPQPAPQPKPKAEPDTRPRPKDDTPGKPKEDQSPTPPKRDDKTPDKPKDQDPTRPTDKDGPAKPKPDKDDGKPGRSKPDKDSDKPGKSREGDGKKPNHGKDDNGKSKDKDPLKDGQDRQDKRDEKDRQEKEEDSSDSKDKRLAKIVARIRPILEKRLQPGIAQGSHRALLANLQAWYRLTSLEKRGGAHFTIRATLNPSRDVVEGISEQLRDYLKERELPYPVVLPLPQNYVRPAPVTSAKYINPQYAAEHGRKPSGQYTEGFDYLEAHGFAKSGPQWDRMHLIPREVGGAAKTSNFVPALNSINGPFYDLIEKGAGEAFGSKSPDGKPDPGWYTAKLDRYSGRAGSTYPAPHGNKYPEGFPERLEVAWGRYERKGPGTGRNFSDWKQLSADKTAVQKFPPPPVPGGQVAPPVNINRGNRAQIKRALGKPSDLVMDAIMKERERTPPGADAFKDMDELQEKLESYRSDAGKSLYSLGETMVKIRQHYKNGNFTFQ